MNPCEPSRILDYFLKHSEELSSVITGRCKYGVGLMCGKVQILFFYQQSHPCRYNSRMGTIQCAGTIGGNTDVTPGYTMYIINNKQIYIRNMDNDKCLMQDLHVEAVANLVAMNDNKNQEYNSTS